MDAVLAAGAGLSNRKPEEIVSTDIKTYEAGGFRLAIAQAEVTDLMQIDSYGALVGPDTLRIQRLLPGPIERVWVINRTAAHADREALERGAEPSELIAVMRTAPEFRSRFCGASRARSGRAKRPQPSGI